MCGLGTGNRWRGSKEIWPPLEPARPGRIEGERSDRRMGEFIIPLSEAVDAGEVGPKAANLAALMRAGLPTPGGFCLSADAYRAQIAALGLADTVDRFAAAD